MTKTKKLLTNSKPWRLQSLRDCVMPRNAGLLFATVILTGCAAQIDQMLGLDSSTPTVLIAAASPDTVTQKFILQLQTQGYAIGRQDENVIEFTKETTGIIGALSNANDLQQSELLNCSVLNEGGATRVSCRSYNIARRSDGVVSRRDQTQSPPKRRQLLENLEQLRSVFE